MENFIVENSQAPGAIGDSLAAFPALQAYAWRGEKEIGVYFSCEAVRPLFNHHKVIILEERPEKATVLDIQKFAPRVMGSGMSMSQGYLEEIGLKDVAAIKSPELSLELGPPINPLQTYDILFSPFSNSDNNTQTKVWPEKSWNFLIWGLKERGANIALLGTEGDLKDNDFWNHFPGNKILNRPLREVGQIIRDSYLIISVDNGMNWIAQGVKARHILLLPKTAHPNWTSHKSPKAANLFIDAPGEAVLNLASNALKERKFQ